MFAGIVVNNESQAVDRVFTYRVPDKLQEDIKIGQLVKIPFGRSSILIAGFVYFLKDSLEEDINNIKEVHSIYKSSEFFTDKQLSLIEYIRKTYLSTYLEAIKLFLPPGIIAGAEAKTKEVLYPSKELENKYIKEPYEKIYSEVKQKPGVYTKSELMRKLTISLSPINTLIKNGFLCINKEVVNRYNTREYALYGKKQLNADQLRAIESILHSTNDIFLLQGVTGSGKTEVYMSLVEEKMKEGLSSIILVPEISLTPQMVERFKGRFGNDIAIFHSRLSEGERYDEWFRVKNNKVKLAIGARSAIFLPFDNLGLIVVDEEHENSYKSDSSPKYHVRDIARVISENTGCKVVFGSATPSIEAFYQAQNNEISLVKLDKRIDGASLPIISLVDMREELSNNNKSIFSKQLYEEINLRLLKKEQIILFLNRRGFSTFVSCRKCGFVFKCPNCDIALTYHNNGKLVCHYCGHHESSRSLCPSCGSKYVKYFGIGTEKLESEIKRVFPQARVIRMDFDTTRRKNSYEQIYNDFKQGNADILLGTQMIAKGLDFPNVTLVGVISADLSLNLPDFRSAERTFQLITQVAGRAGRDKKPGKVIVQTYTPHHYSLQCAKNYDYIGFFNDEIKIRELMNDPPFSKILSIILSSEKEDILIKKSNEVGIVLKDKYKEHSFEILGPSPCILSKIKNVFRWQLILKGSISSEVAASIKSDVYNLIKDVYSDIRINIDVNPNSLL